MRNALVLVAIFASGCYKPGVADCLYQCNNLACPSGLECVAGMCTSGTTCSGSGDDDGGGGNHDAVVDTDSNVALCNDHLTFHGGEFCYGVPASVQQSESGSPVITPLFGDWDGDKIKDIVMLVNQDVRYFRGVGDGSFLGPLETLLDDRFSRFIADDLDGDGYDDFLFAGVNKFEIFRGRANAIPVLKDTVPLGGTVKGLSAGRYIDNDDRRSVAIAYQQSLHVVGVDTDFQRLNAGDFPVTNPDQIYGVGTVPRAPQLDQVMIARQQFALVLDTHTVPFATAGTYPGYPDPRGFATTDMDGDGRPDEIEVSPSGLVTVTMGSDGHLAHTATLSGAKTTIAVGNFNGDAYGDFALVVPGPNESVIYVYLGAATIGDLAPAMPLPSTGSVGGDWIAAGDFNHDTIDDFVLLDTLSGAVSVVLSTP